MTTTVPESAPISKPRSRYRWLRKPAGGRSGVLLIDGVRHAVTPVEDQPVAGLPVLKLPQPQPTARGEPLPLLRALAEDGWVRGAPQGLDLTCLGIDGACCARATCTRCRRKGLLYCPHHKGGRYRVVGLCQACGLAEEF
jgi:hypothetical protein